MRDGKPLTERKLAISKALRFIKSTDVEKLLKKYHVIESLLLQEMAKIGQSLLLRVLFRQTGSDVRKSGMSVRMPVYCKGCACYTFTEEKSCLTSCWTKSAASSWAAPGPVKRWIKR